MKAGTRKNLSVSVVIQVKINNNNNDSLSRVLTMNLPSHESGVQICII